MKSAVGLGLLLVAAVALSFRAILPLGLAACLVLVFLWMVWPGAIIARRLYGGQCGWLPALLVAPSWGFWFSSVVLLGLWTSGIRNTALLATTPIFASLLAIPCRRLAGTLDVPRFDRN